MKPLVLEDNKYVLHCMADSSFGDDKDNQLSTTGYGIYIQDVLVSWKSKSQRQVSLSSSEAEYIALSEAVKEMIFIKQVMSTLNVEVKTPMTVYCDNMGAIYMPNGPSTRSRTKHVDLRYHYVRELIENGTICVEFVRTDDNIADIFTKNVTPTIFQRQTTGMIGIIPSTKVFNGEGVEHIRTKDRRKVRFIDDELTDNDNEQRKNKKIEDKRLNEEQQRTKYYKG